MRYGNFDDSQREYVITRPDTPLPWLNYLGSEAYFGIISNTAGGYSFYRDARLRRLTRYRYNNVPADYGGRYIYLRDDRVGSFWSPSWQPVRRTLDHYRCRHGLGYTIIESEYSGIRSQTRYFVPPGETLEIWQLTLTNQRTETAELSLFSLVEFCLWDAIRRHDQFPAQLEHRRGRSRGRRDLSQDRVPRTPRSFCLFRLFGGTGWLRHLARCLPGAVSWFGMRRWPSRPGKSNNSIRARLGTDWLASCSASVWPPGESRQINFVLGYQRESARPTNSIRPAPQTVNKQGVKPMIARYLDAAAGRCGF